MGFHLMLLLLLGLPFLGMFLGGLWVFLTRREQMLEAGELWGKERKKDGEELARLWVLIPILLTKPIYGIMEAFFLALRTGAFEQVAVQESLGTAVAITGVVSSVLSLVTAVADGGILAEGLRRGALWENGPFRTALLKSLLTETAAILGLLAFVLAVL